MSSLSLLRLLMLETVLGVGEGGGFVSGFSITLTVVGFTLIVLKSKRNEFTRYGHFC
jgi:hypothetical protein